MPTPTRYRRHALSKETIMRNDLPLPRRDEDLERNAYNAAFDELGLPWHWDSETYATLLDHSACPNTRIRRYLETRHPHLLTAYEPEFLASAIEERKARRQPAGART
jgi:hypothetical protein